MKSIIISEGFCAREPRFIVRRILHQRDHLVAKKQSFLFQEGEKNHESTQLTFLLLKRKHDLLSPYSIT